MEFAVEPDARRVVQRMRQAAYDVLFNKTNWHSSDVEARDLWPVPTGSASRDRLFATQEVYVSVQPQFYDPFGVFPRGPTLAAESLPSEWWFDRQDETTTRFVWAVQEPRHRRSRGTRLTE
jgi:hypothetical protein